MAPVFLKFKSASQLLTLRLKLLLFSHMDSQLLTDHVSVTKSRPEPNNGVPNHHSDSKVTSHAVLDSMDLAETRVRSEPLAANGLMLTAMMDKKSD